MEREGAGDLEMSTGSKQIQNLIGMLFGYDKCVFCKDRQNWKPWADHINVSDPEENKKIEYEMPMCHDCFCSQPLNSVQHAIKADITDTNNFCRSLRAEPLYSDADQELIMNEVTQAKNKIVEVPGGEANSD